MRPGIWVVPLFLLTVGCVFSDDSSTSSTPSKKEGTFTKETMIGAGVGGLGGGVLGHLVSGKTGMIIGGLAGALAGGYVGNNMNKKNN